MSTRDCKTIDLDTWCGLPLEFRRMMNLYLPDFNIVTYFIRTGVLAEGEVVSIVLTEWDGNDTTIPGYISDMSNLREIDLMGRTLTLEFCKILPLGLRKLMVGIIDGVAFWDGGYDNTINKFSKLENLHCRLEQTHDLLVFSRSPLKELHIECRTSKQAHALEYVRHCEIEIFSCNVIIPRDFAPRWPLREFDGYAYDMWKLCRNPHMLRRLIIDTELHNKNDKRKIISIPWVCLEELNIENYIPHDVVVCTYCLANGPGANLRSLVAPSGVRFLGNSLYGVCDINHADVSPLFAEDTAGRGEGEVLQYLTGLKKLVWGSRLDLYWLRNLSLNSLIAGSEVMGLGTCDDAFSKMQLKDITISHVDLCHVKHIATPMLREVTMWGYRHSIVPFLDLRLRSFRGNWVVIESMSGAKTLREEIAERMVG